jgi:mannose-6-phosphate isomerase-like protein (cupin superfamily)
MRKEATAFVLLPGEGRKIDLGTFEMSVKATDVDTGGAFSLLEASEPPGFSTSLHIHHKTAESFYVLSGEYLMFLDGHKVLCPAGSFVYVPIGTPHAFKVGDMPSRKLNLFTPPAAMVDFFDERASARKAGPVDRDRQRQMALKYSVELLGPLPEDWT